jgi:mono/diheme cytochrome c family protein
MKTALVLALALVAGPSLADAEERLAPVTDPLTRKECGECHMAFPPSLLPARSWDRIMATLSDHFGDDASLPADDTAAIAAYLRANAGDVRRWGESHHDKERLALDQAPMRFTETRAFAHEHRRYTPDRLASRGIKSIVDCVACHRGAEQGYFDDD